jgi:hypothetical protein
MHVNHKEVFFPEPWFKYIANVNGNVVQVEYREVHIHYPLKSLLDTCLWELVYLVETKDAIYDLEVPHSLKAELSKKFRRSARFNPDEDERDLSERFIM